MFDPKGLLHITSKIVFFKLKIQGKIMIGKASIKIIIKTKLALNLAEKYELQSGGNLDEFGLFDAFRLFDHSEQCDGIYPEERTDENFKYVTTHCFSEWTIEEEKDRQQWLDYLSESGIFKGGTFNEKKAMELIPTWFKLTTLKRIDDWEDVPLVEKSAELVEVKGTFSLGEDLNETIGDQKTFNEEVEKYKDGW